MFRSLLLSVALCAAQQSVSQSADGSPPAHHDDLKILQGLWDGTIPEREETYGKVSVRTRAQVVNLVIKGSHAEWTGLREIEDGIGVVEVATSGKRKSMRITKIVFEDGRSQTAALLVPYELANGDLILGEEGRTRRLSRVNVEERPLAQTGLEFGAAKGITASGDLLLTRFAELDLTQGGPPLYQPTNSTVPLHHRTRAGLSSEDAVVFLVHERRTDKITIDHARALLNNQTNLVCLTHRRALEIRVNDPRFNPKTNERWKASDTPDPASPAVSETFTRLLKPGTLVFVLPH
jgi:hypothetical protein